MNGFVILDKEEGMTSFRASGIIRRIFHEKKTGHTGTLDPMATGVLPVALGKATRFIDFLPESDKAYVARFRFGTVTDTLDITGKVLKTSDAFISASETEDILSCFRGDIMQTPPMYSAISVNGVRLYSLARQGVEIEREQRPVTIKKLVLTDCLDGEFEISVECTKGTYIRSLISDIGERAGAGAVMTSLRRTKANGYTLEDAGSPARLEEAGLSAVKSIDSAFMCYPEVYVSSAQAKRFSNGGELFTDRLKKEMTVSLYRVYSPEGVFLGLGQVRAENENLLTAKRVIGND